MQLKMKKNNVRSNRRIRKKSEGEGRRGGDEGDAQFWGGKQRRVRGAFIGRNNCFD